MGVDVEGGVCEGVLVGLDVGECVAVGVGVAVGVLVGMGVWVGAAVGAGAVDVAIGILVGVIVGVGSFIGPPPNARFPQTIVNATTTTPIADQTQVGTDARRRSSFSSACTLVSAACQDCQASSG